MNAWDLSCRSSLPADGRRPEQPQPRRYQQDAASRRKPPRSAGLFAGPQPDPSARPQAPKLALAGPSSTNSSLRGLSPASGASYASPGQHSISSMSPVSTQSNTTEIADERQGAASGPSATIEALTLGARCSESSADLSDSNASPDSFPASDRKARKKDQNRRAASNYRRKKMEEKNRMREEEMRLVYSRVCLVGYAERLEGSIMYILNTKTRKILDKDRNAICFICPVCLLSCDNTLNLRRHLSASHHSESEY